MGEFLTVNSFQCFSIEYSKFRLFLLSLWITVFTKILVPSLANDHRSNQWLKWNFEKGEYPVS